MTTQTRCALVTGAISSIGQATAELLATTQASTASARRRTAPRRRSTRCTQAQGPFLLPGRLAPAMAARNWERVVNVTRMIAYLGMADAALYGSSKTALQLLTQAWAAEYGPSGVNVNSVAPSLIRTPGTAPMADAVEQIGETVPAGRVGTPDEVAAAVAYLVSEQAAYVNGTTLAVDGGRVAV